MRLARLLPAGLVAASAVCMNFAPAAAQTGSVKGTFVFEGEVPELPPKVKEGENVKDGQVCAADAVPDQTYVVDPSTKGLANVFIWVQRIDKDEIPEEFKKPKQAKITIDQKGCVFVPHCVVAQEGQTLVMLNGDAVAHNVHLSAVRGKEINDLVAPNDRKGVERPLKADLMPMPVKCDIHPWMIGHMLILDHPYAALSDEKGQFTIEGLPEGTYDFRVWHESQGYVKVDAKGIEVRAGKATDMGKLTVEAK
ncbi:MAG: carboxypeptidase regulatory-like domain-containing protein [Planctomycetota bacterium]|nr:hypothetical protein [Planctomycetaceae bacterium]MDQ3329863.1 carboxypeptidase regulatory-like domain-containing protein [Planctomycetota bacterium]